MSYPQPYGQPMPPVANQLVLQPYRCSSAHVVIAWVLAVGTAGYLLPWAVAATRNRSNVGAIALINLFLGWSLVGWVVALVMACGSDRPVVVIQQAYAPPVWGPPSTYPQTPPTPYPGPTLPPAPARPLSAAPEPTRIDPLSSEPTVWFPPSSGYDDRR